MFFIGPEIKSVGRAEFVPHDHGKVITVGTVQCCHCGKIWHLQPGSGKRRGICTRCKTDKEPGITCGRPECDTCIGGVDRLLDNLEAGLPWNQALQHRPIFVPFNDLE